jgi:DNA-damage-inducible protein J
MNTAIINIKTQPYIKKQAQQVAEDLGLTLSSTINAFLRDLIRNKTINFSLNETPSPYLIKQLKKSKKNIKTGEISPTFSNHKDAIKWLNSDK